MSWLRATTIAAVFTLLVAAGCGGVDPAAALAEANSTNLRRLTTLYFSYQTTHDWRGPADEETFKEFLRSYDEKKLVRIGVDPQAVDALFVSERDGQSFKIRYAATGSARGSHEPVIFESQGVEGKRQVGFLDMEVREVEDEEYQRLWSGNAPQSGQPGPPARLPDGVLNR